MKRQFPWLFGFLALLLISAPLQAQSDGSSESLGKAEVNRVINDVYTVEDIRREKPRIHPSSEGEVLGQYHALRTAEKARAELLFSDGSLARVGSDAYFSFSSSERDVQMGKGTALFQVPKNSEETNVQTATATASLTGTTLMVNQQPGNHVKAAVIEGSVDMSMPDRAGESRSLQAGEMIVMPTDAQRLPEPVDVDLQELVNTSGLINEFDEDEEDEETTEGDETTEETDDTEETETETTEEASEESGEVEESPETTETTQQGTDETTEQGDDGESTLNMDQLSEGLEQQQEEIESGELEETGMVMEGDGTELTLVESEDEANRTTTSTQQDAVDQKSETTETLNIDGNSEVYLGTSESDPPTVGEQEGVIFTPDSTSDAGFQGTSLSSSSVDEYLALMSKGAPVAKFSEERISVAGTPEVTVTDQVFDLAFVSESSIELGSTSLQGISGASDLFSLSLVTKGSNLDWVLPEISTEAVSVGLLGNGSGSSMELNDVLTQGAVFAAGTSGDLMIPNRTLDATEMHLGSANGLVDISGSNVTSGTFLDIKSERTSGPSIEITDSTQLRTLGGQVGLETEGGDISIRQSTLGYYSIATSGYSVSDGSLFVGALNPDQNSTVSLRDSTLKAQDVLAQVTGPNGTLVINGSTIGASGALQLYAAGSDGMVRFSGDSSLEGSSLKEIAGKTVQVDNGVNVIVDGDLAIYADNRYYSNSGSAGGCDGPCGGFSVGTTLTQDSFGSFGGGTGTSGGGG